MNHSEHKRQAAAPRSPMFRALGADEPPRKVVIQGGIHERVTVFKHDSWAATALYEGPAGKVVCKFNRRQSIRGVPMRWLGRILAQHEAMVLQLLADVPYVPRWLGPVSYEGRVLENVSAHNYIEGHPLAHKERVSARFFDRLTATLAVMHERGLAYVDLHKRENILVGDDGNPYLFDFQISFALPRRWPGTTEMMRAGLKLLQQADWYHLEKHRRACLGGEAAPAPELPWFIRGHRLIGAPLRNLRRRLLVALGMRTGKGRVESEHFPEDAVRRMIDDRPQAA